jgi:hypothetical protein
VCAAARRGGVSGVRGRRITAFLAAGLLGLAAAGCGGNDDLAPEVPGPPADVVIPQSAEAPGAAASNESGSTDGTTDESGEDTGSGTTGDTGTTTPDTSGGAAAPDTTTPDASGGTTAPDTTADGPTNDTPPPEGSNAEQFEDFCAQNPGAC